MFRKTAAIILFIVILIISLIFSMIGMNRIFEGIDEDTVLINNPPPSIIQKLSSTINSDNYTIMDKMLLLQPIVKKYVITNDIFNEYVDSYYDALRYAFQKVPSLNEDSLNPKDKEDSPITMENRVKAKMIINNTNINTIDKISQLKSLSGENKTINDIQEKNEKIWLDNISAYLKEKSLK